MARRHSAFLLRQRHNGGDGARRIKVVHIQSSARAVVSSLGAATDWIDALSRDLSSPPARGDGGMPRTYPAPTTPVNAPGDPGPLRAAPRSALPTPGRRSDAEGTAGRIGE